MDGKFLEFLIIPIIPLMWALDKLLPPDVGPGGLGVGVMLLFGLIVCFYASLVTLAAVSWWGYSLVAYAAFFASGYYMNRPLEDKKSND